MSERFRTTQGRSGIVYQSGLDIRPRGAYAPLQPHRGPYRAVVVNTYVSDTDDRSYRQEAAKVTCDVVLVRSGQHIKHVPVQQPSWGENDAQSWIPKESTRVISGNEALNVDVLRSSRGSYQRPITPLDDLDGDVVLLDFIEGDLRSPIIIGALPHPKSKRTPIEGIGHTEGVGGDEDRGKVYRREAYFRHAGVEARVSGIGDVLLDTVGATDDRVDEDPEHGDSAGHVRVRLKDTQRLSIEMDGTDVMEVWNDGSQVRVDLGEGAAQRLILGDDFRTFFNDWLSQVFAKHQHLAGTYLAPSGGGAVTLLSGAVSPVTVPPAVPTPPLSYTSSSMSADLLSDLARTKKS